MSACAFAYHSIGVISIPLRDFRQPSRCYSRTQIILVFEFAALTCSIASTESLKKILTFIITLIKAYTRMSQAKFWLIYVTLTCSKDPVVFFSTKCKSHLHTQQTYTVVNSAPLCTDYVDITAIFFSPIEPWTFHILWYWGTAKFVD
jgi:hypothetical protein